MSVFSFEVNIQKDEITIYLFKNIFKLLSFLKKKKIRFLEVIVFKNRKIVEHFTI